MSHKNCLETVQSKNKLNHLENDVDKSYGDDKRMHSTDSLEICTHETSEYLVCKNEGIKCNNLIKQ